LTEVLKEREAQLEMKKLIEAMRLEQENELQRKSDEIMEKKLLIDTTNDEKKLENIQQLTKYRQQQSVRFDLI
jgi:hypothetical protein